VGSGTGRGGPWAYVGRSRGRLREQRNGNWGGPGRGAWSKGIEQSGGGRRGGGALHGGALLYSHKRQWMVVAQAAGGSGGGSEAVGAVK
jgi:hypothetical protein